MVTQSQKTPLWNDAINLQLEGSSLGSQEIDFKDLIDFNHPLDGGEHVI